MGMCLTNESVSQGQKRGASTYPVLAGYQPHRKQNREGVLSEMSVQIATRVQSGIHLEANSGGELRVSSLHFFDPIQHLLNRFANGSQAQLLRIQ